MSKIFLFIVILFLYVPFLLASEVAIIVDDKNVQSSLEANMEITLSPELAYIRDKLKETLNRIEWKNSSSHKPAIEEILIDVTTVYPQYQQKLMLKEIRYLFASKHGGERLPYRTIIGDADSLYAVLEKKYETSDKEMLPAIKVPYTEELMTAIIDVSKLEKAAEWNLTEVAEDIPTFLVYINMEDCTPVLYVGRPRGRGRPDPLDLTVPMVHMSLKILRDLAHIDWQKRNNKK